jgi:hypothetical protein
MSELAHENIRISIASLEQYYWYVSMWSYDYEQVPILISINKDNKNDKLNNYIPWSFTIAEM